MKEVQKSKFLGEEKISKLMVKFSVPCVLSLLVGAFYNIVDQIFIGNSELSTLGNAATGVVFPVFIIVQAFAWSFSNGCATYMNICQGRNDFESAPKAVGTTISTAVLISSVIMAVIFPLKRPLLMLFGASEANIGLAVEYVNIILAFAPTLMLSNMIASIISADGSPGYSMMASLSGAVTNIILDPIFIFALDMGMTGAALATVAGQVVSCILTISYLRKAKTFRLKLKHFIPNFKILCSILKFGSSTFVTQCTLLVITVLSNAALVTYGALSTYGKDIPVAVMGIATKVFTLLINIVVGIVLGCQPIISYNMGAKKYHRVKKLYFMIFACTATVSLIFTMFFQFAPHLIIRLFGVPSNIPNPEDYWLFANRVFRIYLMLVVFTCTVKMNSIFFQSAGKPLFALISSVIRDIVCFAPLILILPKFFGIDGILYAAPISDIVAVTVTLTFTILFLRSLRPKKKEEQKE